MTVTPIRVLVVDDQPLFCAGIGLVLNAERDMTCIGAAYDAESAVATAIRDSPDIVLMDIRMPGLSGITATARITARAPATRVLMLTTFQRDGALQDARRAGASGFVTKDADPATLIAAIRLTHAGGHPYASPNAAAMLDDATDGPNLAAIVGLSARERDIFLHVAAGLGNADIAQAAYVSEATVKSHVSSILNKLSLASRAQLIAFAYANHLVT